MFSISFIFKASLVCLRPRSGERRDEVLEQGIQSALALLGTPRKG